METIYDMVNTEARTVWYRERPDAEVIDADVEALSPFYLTRARNTRAYCAKHNIPLDPPF